MARGFGGSRAATVKIDKRAVSKEPVVRRRRRLEGDYVWYILINGFSHGIPFDKLQFPVKAYCINMKMR